MKEKQKRPELHPTIGADEVRMILRQMSQLMEKINDGTIAIDGRGQSTPQRKPTIKEQRTQQIVGGTVVNPRHQQPLVGSRQLSPDLANARVRRTNDRPGEHMEPSQDGMTFALWPQVRSHAEPRRSSRERILPARRVYVLHKQKIGKRVDLSDCTPAMIAVLRDLAIHKQSTVMALATRLDLRRKTIENIVSVLCRRQLIESHPIGDLPPV